MSEKIYIKQIAKAYDGDGSIDTEYLDSKGRVWYDAGRNVLDEKNSTINGDGSQKNVYKWVSNWKQVDLPEEPEVDF